MKTERTTLLAALDVVKPAIATKALLEELTHVWFSKGQIVAYDDVLGIRVPFECDGLEGGLKGALISGLLNASGAKTVEISVDGKEAELKAARAKLKLAVLDPDRAVWDFPNTKKSSFFPLSKELLAALSDVLIAVGQDTSIPDQLGVTFVMTEDGLSLYTTDSKTIAEAFVKKPKDYDVDHVVLPTPFIEQLLRLCGPDGEMAILKDSVVAYSKSGIGIYARLVDCPDPSDFETELQRALPKGFRKAAVDIPEVMKLAVERALVVLDGKVAEPISLYVKDKVLHMEAESGLGELRDQIPLEQEHEDVDIKVDPALIKRALEKCDKMLVADRCLCMIGRGGDFVYVISSIER